ncbi:hypothetical protein KKG90_12065 [Candidatus Bipolaricaulota bacterium]|nr:hypothetical protein [Candidatus Bipolaricaulota bacterium]
MPILDLEVIVAQNEDIDPGWAQQIADVAGSVFGTPPGRTWVRMRAMQQSHDAENATSRSENLHPIFVTVPKAQNPPIELLRVEALKLTQEIACITERQSENIHVLYLPPAVNRMAFGGIWVE